jgi:hypothetical protein
VVAYLACLCLTYLHGSMVVHPATRRWIFPPLVFVELLLFLVIWNRAQLLTWLRSYPWLETLLLLGAMTFGFSRHPGFDHLVVPQIGKLVAGATAVLFLGLFITAARQYARSVADVAPDPWSVLACALGPLGAVLAGLPSNMGLALAFAMLVGLVYLAWLSPLRLVRSAPLYSLFAALALWVTTWAGYSCGQITSADAPMTPPPPPGGSEHFEGPVGPPDRNSGAPGGFPGPVGLPPEMQQGGPPPGPDAPGGGPPFGGPGEQRGSAPTLQPEWLLNPLWLATPVAIYCCVLAGRRLRRTVFAQPGGG